MQIKCPKCGAELSPSDVASLLGRLASGNRRGSHQTNETRQKISDSQMQLSDEARRERAKKAIAARWARRKKEEEEKL